MIRFIIFSLSSNSAVIITATILFFIGHVITDGGWLSMVLAAFLLSPILISISNNKRHSIKNYFSKLFSLQSLKYFIVIAMIFIVAILLTSAIALQIDVWEWVSIFLIITYSICYLLASPLLFRIATGVTGNFPNVKKSALIVGTLIVYVLTSKALTAISYSSGLLLVATSLIGCFFLIATFCIITASYSYKTK